MLPSADYINRTIHFVPGIPVVYLHNPKVACSTMKKSLWLRSDEIRGTSTFTGQPHDRPRSPFPMRLEKIVPHIEELVAAKFVAIVRNPFTRALSAYLDKVAKEKRDLAVWIPLARSLGLKPGDRPSFGEFLTRIVDLDPWVMDRHFTPQYVNVLSDYVTPDFVGHLEDMDSVEKYLGGQGLPIIGHSPHQTGASHKMHEYYQKDEVSLVCQYYHRDFEIFGYSQDPSALFSTHEYAVPSINRSVLRELIRNRAGIDASTTISSRSFLPT